VLYERSQPELIAAFIAPHAAPLKSWSAIRTAATARTLPAACCSPASS